MVTMPGLRPLTIPVEPAVAMLVLLLLHEPPAGDAVSVIGVPMHAVLPPDITGVVLTVNPLVTKLLPAV